MEPKNQEREAGSCDITGFLDHASPEASAVPPLDFTVIEASLSHMLVGIQSSQLRRVLRGGTISMEKSLVSPSLLSSLDMTSILQVSVSFSGEGQIETTAVMRLVMTATYQTLSASINPAEGFYIQHLI